jgi:hypothetical protein
MMSYYSGQPFYYQYSPYQYYGMNYAYPLYGYGYSYYGLPLGYAYAYPAMPVTYDAALQDPRGEHRVGNCLMVCQWNSPIPLSFEASYRNSNELRLWTVHVRCNGWMPNAIW